MHRPEVREQGLLRDLTYTIPKKGKHEMNETENKQQVCAANCPLNRVITVHEIGEKTSLYQANNGEFYGVPSHFGKYEKERTHHFLLHAIKEIGPFDLPVFEFKEKKNPGFSGWLGGSTVEYKKVKDVSGGWIRLDDDETIYVSESFEELKKLIEGTKKEEQ